MTISEYLEADHRRIEQLLLQATAANDRINPELWQQFRGPLLRHIGMEEKILFPAIRRAGAGESFQGLGQLHLDHGALAALLVPTPTASIIAAIRAILDGHNRIEEGPEGTYRRFEQMRDIDAGGILATLQAAPAVVMNPHVDNATSIASMRAAVQRAGYAFDL